MASLLNLIVLASHYKDGCASWGEGGGGILTRDGSRSCRSQSTNWCWVLCSTHTWSHVWSCGPGRRIGTSGMRELRPGLLLPRLVTAAISHGPQSLLRWEGVCENTRTHPRRLVESFRTNCIRKQTSQCKRF